MANAEWNNIPFVLTTPAGTVNFNPWASGFSGVQWILDQDGCQAGSAKRITRDNSAQQGGEIVHRKFKTGFVMQLKAIAIESYVDAQIAPACGADLVTLFDALMLNLDAIENADGKLVWTPTGHANRLMNACRWLGPDGLGGASFTAVLVAKEEEIFTTVQFALLTPFPYAMDAAEITTALVDGVPVNINNGGTTSFYPVIEVFGPSTAFTLINNTTGLQLKYDSTLPGASAVLTGSWGGGSPTGDWIEFDFFRNTAYKTGSGANRKPGIDVVNSDFWPIVPGVNNIELLDAGGSSTAIVKWQNAYV